MSSKRLPGAILGALLLLVVGCARAPVEEESWLPTPPSADRDRSGITEDEIRDRPGRDIRELLDGRVSGVWVSQSSTGGLVIRIRGRTTIQGNDHPLYVLDGIAIQPGPDGSLQGINPYDIESIKVLRGPAETAIWGLRGANGVIVIKLKGGDH